MCFFVGFATVTEDRESYQCRVARKAALSNWLAEAAEERISQEVDAANFQVITSRTNYPQNALG